jgi:hypothetical protein
MTAFVHFGGPKPRNKSQKANTQYRYVITTKTHKLGIYLSQIQVARGKYQYIYINLCICVCVYVLLLCPFSFLCILLSFVCVCGPTPLACFFVLFFSWFCVVLTRFCNMRANNVMAGLRCWSNYYLTGQYMLQILP